MKTRLLASTALFALVLAPASTTTIAAPRRTVYVTNSNDTGPGSFRHAIDVANVDPSVARVQFRGSVSIVPLTATVYYTGVQDLSIDGDRAVLDGTAAGGDIFVATSGSDLSVSNLTVRNSQQEGIEVQVPAFATGTVHVALVNVSILDNLGHGVLINDQEDPLTTDPDGSAASVDVTVAASRFIGNGYSVSDRDGLRVNEGGVGDLKITIVLTASERNAADGIEVDERGAGDVRIEMLGSRVDENGRFDPLDFDDGFDIDEAGDGSIVGRVILSQANNNFEEGFDFNENNAGDLRVDMLLVEASGNGEEGIDYEEDDDFAGGGDLVTTMTAIKTNGNKAGDAGLKIREKGVGILNVTVNGVEASNNLTGGISVREDAEGSLVSKISNATAVGNTGHGIDFDENRANSSDSGDLTATVTRANSSNNGGAGVRADQAAPGVGTATLTSVTLNANTGGPTTGGGVTFTIVP